MQCILRILEGPSAGNSIVVAPKETVTVGRTERAAGVVIPGDVMMSRLHFSLRSDGQSWVLKDEGSTHGTFVNGERVTETALNRRDLVVAGSSSFEVDFQEDAEPAPAADRATVLKNPQKEEQPVLGFIAPTAAEVIARFSLKFEPLQPDEQSISCEDLIRKLAGANRFDDSLKFASHALPKRSAVWWASQVVRAGLNEHMTKEDELALGAAETWVKTPEEECRRAAMSIADKLGHKTPASWVAVAAFWSGGSMAPPGAPAVPPAEDLTGKAAFGAVQLAAVAREPEKAIEKQRQFIELAHGCRSREKHVG